jgi:Xaa-Pro aminopeptidase
MTSEIGIAEVLVTPDRALILTSRIEAKRLRDEEIPDCFELEEFAWADDSAATRFTRAICGERSGGRILSDRPESGEEKLPIEFHDLRLVMTASEIERYRTLGCEAAEAMFESFSSCDPTWTEYQLAGRGANALWARGIEPTLVLVAGEERLPKYRHPIATSKSLGTVAMMVFCGRRNGLYANLTRFVAFRSFTGSERRRHEQVAQVEATAFDHSRPGVSTGVVFDAIARSYERIGEGEEILNHHQGGPTGYLSREEVAVSSTARSNSIILCEGMAVAWNPSLPGAKIEDTVLITSEGVEVLTRDPDWPSMTVAGRLRPDVWERK